MDPSLQELLQEIINPEEELEVIMRLVLPNAVPDKVKVISVFGDVITCRIKRKDIDEVYASPLKFSLKASKYFSPELNLTTCCGVCSTDQLSENEDNKSGNEKEPVLIGIIDWGCDFTHPNFINADGTSRILAIWDQTLDEANGTYPYNYGRTFTRYEINEALKTSIPFRHLGYHPAKADNAGIGAHGTHVMDIAGGNGAVGKKGVAPNAEFIFVHLGAGDTSGTANLGDSVRILEAIDFIRKIAAHRPLVINMSVGRHGGPHDGNTLVERAIDNFLETRHNTMLCQSTGNYYMANTHASGIIKSGKSCQLSFNIDKADVTLNEIEVWYSGKDKFQILLKKNEAIKISVLAGEKKDIVYNGKLIGRIYHRQKDPINLKNHINIFLYPNAPPGIWDIFLTGEIISDGRFNAWIERDSGCKKCQARFLSIYTSLQGTTGTICNGFNSLVVGAYDDNAPQFEIGKFSSQGPTTDGRYKPDLVAPGVKIVAAKSASRRQYVSKGELTIMSGTSMAAPKVTGTVARILEILPVGTPYYIVRNIINGSTNKILVSPGQKSRVGNGILNTAKAIQLAQLHVKSRIKLLPDKKTDV